jgi:sugar phosphate isomerase/epimerase
MDKSTLKLAAYLDEAGEEPDRGCKTLNETGIHYATLRHVWTGNICGISDVGHQRLTKILSNHDISIIMIASELGKVDSQQLAGIDDSQIDDAINICKYYKAPMLRVFAGEENPNTSLEEIGVWMQRVGEKCFFNGITPLLELAQGAQVHKAPEVAQLLANNKRWKLLYDPVALILKQNIDPFIRYWTLLKQYVAAVDVRDLKIGKGFKPPGFGDSRINLTVNDALKSKFDGWFILEPSLGRRHGSAVTKSDTFKYALEGLDHILKDL